MQGESPIDFRSRLPKLLEQVQPALAEYYLGERKESLKSLSVLRLVQRPYSAVVFLQSSTTGKRERLVMKTTLHHPMNKSITEQENQATVEFNILSRLYPKFSAVEGCSVPRPVIVLPEIETYLTEFVEGPLLSCELRHARYFSSQGKFRLLNKQFYYCGKWLRSFQQFTGIRSSGPEALQWVFERCRHRLRMIEDLDDSRWPPGLHDDVMASLQEQISQLSDDEVQVSGRHGDFGTWNILVNPQAVTVLDFLGYQEGPIAVDLLKMLTLLEEEKMYPAASPRRIDLLRRSFITGYGHTPEIPRPVVVVCETLHRLYRIVTCLTMKGGRLPQRFQRRSSLQANLAWLADNRGRTLLWPPPSGFFQKSARDPT